MACVFDQILRRFHDPEKVMNYCCKGPINMRLQSDGRWCIPKCSQGPYGREQVDLGELSRTELTHLNSFECRVGGEGGGWRNPTGADQLCLQAKSFWSPRKE